MASAVTYNGVESAEGGNIFKDCRFWVAQRVPQRPMFVNMIKQNGGTVVPLEKHADMLIADYTKIKDVPPGSYSWKFIEDSVKHGIIQLKDKYLIGRHSDAPRPVGSHQNSRSTRTKFDAEDDARIAKWVLEHPLEQKGNKIWQEYERINPRHTAQSWRDRYIKKLYALDRSDLERMAASAPEEPGLSETSKKKASPVQQTRTEPARKHESLAERPISRRNVPLRSRDNNMPSLSSREPSLDDMPTKEASQLRNDNHADMIPQSQQTLPQTTEEDCQTEILDIEQEEDRAAAVRREFYEDLDQYISAYERDIKRQLTINGRTIDLFALVVAVKDSPTNQESQMADWYTVAENLGFDDPDEGTVNELYACYTENLVEFLEALETFEPDGEEEGPGLQDAAPDMDLSQDIDFEDGQDGGLPQSYVRSSPPIAVAGFKRSAGQRPLSSSGHLIKKRRYHKDMEIPSTPDAELAPQLPPVQETSPSARKSSQWRDYVGESEASQHLPPLPPLQDESQDLGTGPSPRQDVRHQSVDLAPALSHEALDPTPIPFSLNRSLQGRSSAKRRQESHAESSRRNRDSSLVERAAPRRTVSSAKPDPKPTTRPTVRRSLPASFNSSRNPTPRSRQPGNVDKSNSREIQKWTSHYESLGYPRHIVVEALKRTTLTPGTLAILVMQHLSNGRDVPSHHEGIWTDRDDGDLKIISGVDFNCTPTDDSEERQQQHAQNAHNRLIKKHGLQRYKLRMAFLEAQTDEGRNNSEN
ncbi:hypothetical protein FSARC_1013 [Fusarium sarcochroum]|uniref:DNA-binding protein RAP1 n=1 Tax=Fusarium sarcochroum TaxID=1208366 RepID=A0A8H4UA00_9HYPO|nr:hypothetical protein FSARC_1013 [Fusarium sarcochroum]